ncbi:hypothetical protein E2C01_002890 [Portunus trituberculatus]|uniref:Uncharacterized protein n=1 Tax=Portunus trituberculatus TaxID=210409 RepID=A0A5B7CL37_PORTR|nr:hypothetical protein [Portunus trituberculatus]
MDVYEASISYNAFTLHFPSTLLGTLLFRDKPRKSSKLPIPAVTSKATLVSLGKGGSFYQQDKLTRSIPLLHLVMWPDG